MNEYDRLYKNSGRVRIFFYLISLLTLIASFSTNFWSITQALVTESEVQVHQRNNGQLVTDENYRYRTRFGGTIHWPSVEYQYVLDENQYENDTFCICLPLGLNPPVLDQEIKIYYLAHFPSISVIQTGPHFLLPILFALFGLAGHLIQSLLIRLKQR